MYQAPLWYRFVIITPSLIKQHRIVATGGIIALLVVIWRQLAIHPFEQSGQLPPIAYVNNENQFLWSSSAACVTKNASN